MLYRRKPTEVEAFQVTEEMCWDVGALPEWVRQLAYGGPRRRVEVAMPHGKRFLYVGYFVVRGKDDKPTAYDAEEFAEQFEQVEIETRKEEL